MIPYNIYYKQYGFRKLEQIISPRLFTLNELPRDSFIHYFTNDEKHPDIDVTLPYLTSITSRRLYIDIPDFLLGNSLDEKDKQLFPGNPIRKNLLGRNLIRDFVKEHKQFRFIKDHYKIINDKLTIFINNYNYLNIIYKYRDMPLTDYYKWFNNQTTIYKNINEACLSSEKNNLVFINIPKDIIPGYSYLRTYSNKTNLSMIKLFDTIDKLMILDIWRWLDPSTRHLSTLNNIPKENLGKVSFIFITPDNRSCVLNLAYLYSWMDDNENITIERSLSQYKFDRVQLLFLKLLNILQSNVPEEVIADNLEKVLQDDKEISVDIKDKVEEQVNDLETDDLTPNEKEYNERLNLFKDKPNEDKQIDEFLNKIDPNKDVEEFKTDDELQDINLDVLFKDIDEELDVLDKLSKKQLLNKNIIIDENGEERQIPKLLKKEITEQEAKSSVYDYEEPSQVLNNLLLESADINIISAAEYRKLDTLIKQYDTMKDPYGSDKTVKELSTITKEELAIDNKKSEIAATDLIPDTSMKESSLQSFTSDYVNNVMKKDIVSMLGSLQKSGIVITKHQVQVENSALGTYENHVVELKPIDGMASTVRFRIPKINEDGSFFANGNKYLIRAQKVDLNIKKIDPTTVALSSYYGKTFVNLNTRKSNNSVEWIAKQINKQTIEGVGVIVKVNPANVFNSDFEAPYIYNALAEKYKTIQTKNLTLVFDYTERNKIVNEELLNKLETKGSRVIGLTNKKEPVVIDTDNNFYIYNNNLVPIGNIYDILEIDESLSPVDFVTVKVFGKDVPVVTVLGYLIGIRKLLKVLGTKYKVMEGKNFKNLLKDEFKVSFKDETYIFSRKDKISSLILSGLLEYEKELKKHTFDELDNKDIYFNLLQTKGLGSIYIKEIDILDKLFVDSITKGILEDLGKPQTYRGLLIEATKMLTTYNHPNAQDQMRIRGYERISGFIYKELAASIRQYKNKSYSTRAKIDISPYHIWSKIMTDPSVKLVEDTNPIQALKEREVVTFVGEGGRSKESMSKKTRIYQPSDMGVISEATVDSSDVGINAYMSANPQFKNLRGIVKDNKEISPTSLLSTSALLAPGADRDDPKRVFDTRKHGFNILCYLV